MQQMLKPIMFADDTSFFSSHSNVKDLIDIANKEIKNVSEWCSINKSSVNTKKKQKIYFSMRKEIKTTSHFA